MFCDTRHIMSVCVCMYVYVSVCLWKLIKCQWSRKMIRGDWRRAHKRSIIPPSDRRRYRPTRWSKSTKGEERDTIRKSVITVAYFDEFTCKERDGGGQSALSAPIFISSLSRSRWIRRHVIRFYSFRIENWAIYWFLQKKNYRQYSHTLEDWRKLRESKLFRHFYPHPHFSETSFYESRER